MAKAKPSAPAKPAEAEQPHPSAAALHRKAQAVRQDNARRLKETLRYQQHYDDMNAEAAARAAKVIAQTQEK